MMTTPWREGWGVRGFWGFRGVRAGLLLLSLLPAVSHARSCLLDAPDAEQLSGRAGKLDRLSIGKVAVTPCEGVVTRGDAQVLFSRGAGVTQIAVVRRGRNLRDDIPQPLFDIAAPGGIVGSLWQSLTSPRATRPGSKRFDDAEALLPGGQVLRGRDLRVPLGRFGWDPAAPVQLRGGGPPRSLRSESGRLTLALAYLPAGAYELVQGARAVPLEIVEASALDGLDAQLREIAATSPDESTRLLRETLLFWEYGLVMNAVDSDDRRERLAR